MTVRVSLLPAFGTRIVLLAFLLLPAVAAHAASSAPAELETGLVRFALDTGDLAPVLGLADHLQGESAPFLRARLWLGAGATAKGLNQLREVSTGQYHRGEAALILGRQLLATGQTEARGLFELAARAGFGDTRQQAQYELAELARKAGRTDQAGRILAGMEEGYWAAVGYLNLSSDYAREDLNPSRALVALRVALALVEKDGGAERTEALRSRILVRAGYLAYHHGEYEKAIGFLEKVGLDGYRTPEALYLHGLALAERGNHRAAMQSWHRAKKYPLAYPGVADAWIGMGRGYDLSGYLGQAGEAYLAANAAYESERVTLRKLADGIREEGAYKALVQDAYAANVEWFLADSRTLTQPRLAYLFGFVEAPAAQEAVGRVARLASLAESLSERGDNLTVFIETLGDQLSRLAGRTEPVSGAALQAAQRTLEARMATLSKQSGARARQQQLAELSAALSDTGARLEALDQRVASRPTVLRRQLDQARELKASGQAHLEQVRALQARASAILDDMALEYVARQDQRMAFALDKTEQQIAHLYEYLALENLAEESP